MNNSIDIELSDAQYEFLYAEQPEVLFCGGVGSGKTASGALKVIQLVQDYPGVPGLITANTHSQLTKATLTELFKWLDKFKIPYKYLVNQNVLWIYGEKPTKILCYSVEKPENIAGLNVGWCWMDESSFYKKLAYDKASARVRDKNGPCQIFKTTTPNGFNWLYEHYIEKANDRKRVIYSSSKDNAVNLDGGFLSRLDDAYDKKMAEQEIDGAFVNLNAGQVYYGFDRRKHIKEGVHLADDDLMLVGLDFNVHPLCGVFVAKRGEMIYVVDELYLENSNTFEAAKAIKSRYPARYIEVVADETGNRRRTNSKHTDHLIIEKAGLTLAKFRNPAVKDRHNNLNRLFDKGFIKIHPRCKYLVKDLEQLVHDNKDDMLSHISDALGYACWHIAPLRKPRRGARVLHKG
jgi:PBSX family phage terminase large subunit